MTLSPFQGHRLRVAGFAVSLVVAGCAVSANVAVAELSPVVARDGVVFSGLELPDKIVDDLADRRVVVLGETHHLREHWEFTAVLLEDLHARGFRQLLVEQPQMADPWLDGYVGAGDFDPGWDPPPNWERKFAELRTLNATLPESERIHVRAIDVNEAYYGGAESFRFLLEGLVGFLRHSGPVGQFLEADYTTGEEQAQAISTLITSLEADRSGLVESWGSDWYSTVVEMAEVERASVEIRTLRETDDDAAARAREDVIKELADARISDYTHGTTINMGGHHAQKSPLMGTDQEWLGDYLVHTSTATAGSVIVIGFTSAKTILEPEAGGTPFDVVETSPEHELLRIMAETWPGQNVYLPLDDSVFSDSRVAYNSEEVIYATPLKEVYDALIQYGTANRMPSD